MVKMLKSRWRRIFLVVMVMGVSACSFLNTQDQQQGAPWKPMHNNRKGFQVQSEGREQTGHL